MCKLAGMHAQCIRASVHAWDCVCPWCEHAVFVLGLSVLPPSAVGARLCTRARVRTGSVCLQGGPCLFWGCVSEGSGGPRGLTSASSQSSSETSPSCVSEAGPGALLSWRRSLLLRPLRWGRHCPWPPQARCGKRPRGPGPGDTRCPAGPPDPGRGPPCCRRAAPEFHPPVGRCGGEKRA